MGIDLKKSRLIVKFRKNLMLSIVIIVIVAIAGLLSANFIYNRYFKKTNTQTDNSKLLDGQVTPLNSLQEKRLNDNNYIDSAEKLSDLKSLAFDAFDANDTPKAKKYISEIISTFPEDKIDISVYELAGLIYKKDSDKAKSDIYFDTALKKASNLPSPDKESVTDRLNKERMK